MSVLSDLMNIYAKYGYYSTISYWIVRLLRYHGHLPVEQFDSYNHTRFVEINSLILSPTAFSDYLLTISERIHAVIENFKVERYEVMVDFNIPCPISGFLLWTSQYRTLNAILVNILSQTGISTNKTLFFPENTEIMTIVDTCMEIIPHSLSEEKNDKGIAWTYFPAFSIADKQRDSFTVLDMRYIKYADLSGDQI